jgi:hypothetical protein
MTLRKAVSGWLVIVLASLCLGTIEARAGSRRSPALADIARTYSPGPDVFRDQDPAPKKNWARRHPVFTTILVVVGVTALIAHSYSKKVEIDPNL